MRRIPLRLARYIGDLAYRSRIKALCYSATLFFLFPLLLILAWELLHR
jgi:hypothetical protein